MLLLAISKAAATLSGVEAVSSPEAFGLDFFQMFSGSFSTTSWSFFGRNAAAFTPPVEKAVKKIERRRAFGDLI